MKQQSPAPFHTNPADPYSPYMIHPEENLECIYNYRLITESNMKEVETMSILEQVFMYSK